MEVPFLNLKRQYQSVKQEMDSAIHGVLDSQKFVLGKGVEEFEDKIAKYLGVRHAIGVASGSDALLLSLKAGGVSGGVVTPPFTFFSTAGAIHNSGAVPVFSDIDPSTFTIGAEGVEKLVKSGGRKIGAVIPVHLFGQAADMKPIMEIAQERSLVVIEDACQAIGEEYHGKKVGSLGLGCFSFFPTKNLGGYGDGGLVTTDDEGLAEKIRSLRQHGSRERYHHDYIGFNSRLDAVQAAVLGVKLTHLEEWIDRRREIAGFYSRGLKDVDGLEVPAIAQGRRHVFNQYTIRVKGGRRDFLRDFLKEHGIGSAVYYPTPLHLQPCFSSLGYKTGDFPNSEKVCGEVLSLPVFPELTKEETEHVVERVLEFFRGEGR
jgi:dTDP-4-amino-4,6-dideoxygalactose transaminase